MNTKRFSSVLIVCIFSILVSVALGQAANPTQLPATVGIGTHPVGGSYYACGTAIARLISEKTQIRAVAQPFAGPNAWMPFMQSGKLEMGLLSAFDAGCAYTGSYGYDQPNPNVRLVLSGNVERNCTLSVLKRSRITKITDLKGKRVGTNYGGNRMFHNMSEAMLKSVGMTWKDVVPVGVPDFQSSIRMLREGRIDAGATGGTTTPAAIELHTALGIKVLAFGDLRLEDMAKGVPADKQALLDDLVPGTFPTIAKAGVGVIEEDTVLISYPIYLAASTNLSEDAVYIILKTIWENYTDLHPVHPWLKGWKPETMPVSNQPAPYHNGAVKFYKEKGVWTDTMQKKQDKLFKP